MALHAAGDFSSDHSLTSDAFRVCPSNYTCIEVGDNPNSGYTNFDTFGWAMMTSFQLITLDFWENVYDYLLRAAGPWHISFFVILVFFGSFYLINLMLAVVTMSYEEESDSVEKEEKVKLM